MKNIQPIEGVVNQIDADIMEVVYEWAKINFGVEAWVQDSTEIREIIAQTVQTRDQAWEERVEEARKEEREEMKNKIRKAIWNEDGSLKRDEVSYIVSTID